MKIATETKNATFLRTWKTLKEDGVENCFFPVKFKELDLNHIDPYQSDLVPDSKYDVMIEAHNNLWYYLREIYFDSNEKRFDLNSKSAKILWCLEQGLNVIVDDLSLTAINKAILAYCSWKLYIGANNTQMIFMDKTIGEARDLMMSIRDSRSIYNCDTEICNMNQVRTTLGNEIRIKAKATTPVNADHIGRSLTSNIVFFSDFSNMKNKDHIMKAFHPIRDLNSPQVIISVDREKDDWYTQKLTMKSLKFENHLFDLSSEQLHEEVNKTTSKMVYITSKED